MKYRIFILLGLFSTQIFGQNLTGPEIIQKVNDLMNPASSYAKAKMTIITSSGQERAFVYDSWSKDHGEKNLIRYIEPKRLKGQATLMTNFADDIWMYFTRTRRVRKMATHAKKQKMEGSDFSYEDMGAGNSFIEDFTSTRLDDKKVEGNLCHQVEMNRKADANISYSRMIMCVRQDNFVPILIQYFDEDNPDQLVKELVQSDIRDVQSIPTAMKMEMINKSDNTSTKMEFIEIEYNLKLDDALFTERGLKQ
ncbi:outer membrane lipoprotein-sorting protein [candidate division KSB1 bacterium]|nr:outer membrane lipoprotein-sorting protein [candidate division KSB1 bacterium]